MREYYIEKGKTKENNEISLLNECVVLERVSSIATLQEIIYRVQFS